jgi:hypothetical protein
MIGRTIKKTQRKAKKSFTLSLESVTFLEKMQHRGVRSSVATTSRVKVVD